MNVLKDHYKNNHLNQKMPTNKNQFDKNKKQIKTISENVQQLEPAPEEKFNENDVNSYKFGHHQEEFVEKFNKTNPMNKMPTKNPFDEKKQIKSISEYIQLEHSYNKFGHHQEEEFVEKLVEMARNNEEKIIEKDVKIIEKEEKIIEKDEKMIEKEEKKFEKEEQIIENDNNTDEDEIDLSQMIEDINNFADSKKYAMESNDVSNFTEVIFQSTENKIVENEEDGQIIQIQDQIVENSTDIDKDILENELDHPVEKIISDKGEIVENEVEMVQIQDKIVENHIDIAENLFENEVEKVGGRTKITVSENLLKCNFCSPTVFLKG